MRKDGKSQYQIKKEKLLKIKEIIDEYTEPYEPEKRFKMPYPLSTIETNKLLLEIWEIVKDEKNNN